MHVLFVYERKNNYFLFVQFFSAREHVSPPPPLPWRIKKVKYRTRAVDQHHKFFADPDPAVILIADPDRAAFLMRIQIRLQNLCKQYRYGI